MPEITQEQVTDMVKAGLEAGGFTTDAAKALKELREVNRAPIGDNTVVKIQEPEKFKTLGEELLAIYKLTTYGDRDNRLEVLKQTGLNEGVGTMGGFLVQTDFMTSIISKAYAMGALMSRCRKIQISSNANSLTINAVNETSRANGSRWGGVLGYWLAEGGTKTASHPEFRQMCLNLHKVIGLCYATDELLQDSAALESIMSQAFTEELAFRVEDAIFRGTGVGQPLGIMTSGALISVARTGAGAIISNDIMNMWTRIYAPSRNNAVWLINQDCEPQLMAMGVTVGLGGSAVYMPQNGLSASPYATLMGKPVIPTEFNPTMGTTGDIMLADLSQYLLADKGGTQTASSIHVAFLTDEQVFRWVYRVDGQPMWNAPLTPYQGTNTLSPFVVLT